MDFQTSLQEVLPRSVARFVHHYDWKTVVATCAIVFIMGVYYLAPLFLRRKRWTKEALNKLQKNYTFENPEVVIVGAGIAGPALAKALADQGNSI
jgi:FlaA1/EpsC-like NDP-sugar epimerase